MNILDRIIAELAPDLAVKRAISRHELEAMSSTGGYYGTGGYTGALSSRKRTLQAYNRALPGTEEHALGEHDRDRLRLECRDLYRNNEIVRGAVDRFVEYAVWKGIRPLPATSDPEWNKKAKAFWDDQYSKTCDYRQLAGVDIVTLQKAVVSHRILDGDLLFAKLDSGQLQPIESPLITTPQKFMADPTITQGVRRTKTGVLTGYFVSPRMQGGSPDRTKSRFIRRENGIFCWEPDRIDQVRGVPRLAPAVAKLRDYDETDEAVLNKVKLDAMQQFKRFVDRKLPNVRGRNASTLTDSDGKNPQRVERHEWGRVHNLGTNENLEPFEGKTPAREYVNYLKHELQAVASCLGIPYEFLMLIFTEGSFSSQRAALIHSKHIFTEWHDWVIKVFLAPLWNWRVAMAMSRGELPPAPVDENGRSEWWRVEWSLPFFDWVDPDKQAKSDERRFDMGATSLSAIVHSQGNSVDTVLREKGADIQKAIETAEEINTANPGAGVGWRDIISTSGSEGPLFVPANEGTEPTE